MAHPRLIQIIEIAGEELWLQPLHIVSVSAVADEPEMTSIYVHGQLKALKVAGKPKDWADRLNKKLDAEL